MNYKISKLFSMNKNAKGYCLNAYTSASNIELFEEDYIKEFDCLLQNGGTNKIATELEEALLDNKILVESNFDEDKFVANSFEEYEKDLFGLMIFPTEQCNLRCVYCYEDFPNYQLTSAHYDLLKNEILRQINENGKKSIVISWFGGEPLLVPNDILNFTQEIKNITEQCEIAFTGAITTNATLLTQDLFLKLVDSGVYVYQITLDGFFHDTQRVFSNGNGSFDLILQNIKNMLATDKEFRLTVRVNISQNDFDFAFYDLFKQYANDERLFFSTKTIGNWGGNENNLQIISKSDAKDYVKKHVEYLENLQLNHHANEPVGMFSENCYASIKDYFAIRANGRINKCTVALNDPANDIGYMNLDNGILEIDEEKSKIWYNTTLQEECTNCEKKIKCYNKSCSFSRIKSGKNICC
ncbi:MAG: radical SAM protein [Firmicutes bacterium]|nr:radical SAM protein [Bacillota bacterium]